MTPIERAMRDVREAVERLSDMAGEVPTHQVTFHTCEIRLGPRPLPAGATVTATESSTAVYVELPAAVGHRMEVWL